MIKSVGNRFSYIILLGLFVFVFAADGNAAPAYGTQLPPQGHFFVGGQTHYVTERELETSGEEIQSLQHFLLLSYGIMDWFALDLKGGAGNMVNEYSGGRLDYPSFMSGGYGFRLKLYDQRRTKAVFGFQHISVHPYSIKVNGSKHKAVIDDWQLSFLVSHRFKVVTPYLGGKWSRMDCIHWVDNERNRVKSELSKSIGVVLGVDVPLSEQLWVNLESQFVDVRAFAASINFAF